jgi:anti-sigma B factor antagonist
MELAIEQLSETLTRATPTGRWDVAGAMSIDLRMSTIAGSGRSVIIDMAQVTFLSSMGIRTIIMAAKAVSLRGARLVLLAPSDHVAAVLTSTGIDALVPICVDLEAARLAVSAG